MFSINKCVPCQGGIPPLNEEEINNFKKFQSRNFNNCLNSVNKSKFNNNILSKSVKILGKNRFINKLFTKVADKGINF